MRRLRYSSLRRKFVQTLEVIILALFIIASTGCKSDQRTLIRLMIWNTRGNNELYKPIAMRFEKSHPGIKVRIEVNPTMGYEEKLIILMGAKDPPDVAMLLEERYPEYIRQKALSDLTEFVNSDQGILKSINRSELKRLYIDKRIKAVPTGLDGILYIVPEASSHKEEARELLSLLVQKTYDRLSKR